MTAGVATLEKQNTSVFERNKWLIILIALAILLYLASRQTNRISNAETFEWTDYKGNQRRLTVHRDVTAR